MAKAKRNTKRAAAAAKKTKRRPAPAKKRATPKRAVKRPTKKAAATGPANLVVVTSGERSLQEVAADLRRAGFKVDQVLDVIGQVTGRAAPGLKARLEKIKGVKDVSEEHPPFNIGPPDAPVS